MDDMGKQTSHTKNIGFFLWVVLHGKGAIGRSWWCDLLDPFKIGSSGAHPLHTFRMSSVLIF